ncbi:MAG: hypothetical protein V4550_14360 [Gemmatimonadota bacterium]
MHTRLRGLLAVVSMLILASGCDKRAPGATHDSQTSLAGKPRVLFLVFGDRADPRVLPVGTLAEHKILPLEFDERGWHGFDNLYFAAGANLAVYRAGEMLGDGVVRRGMWGEGAPLYKLPSCRTLRPLGAVTMSRAPEGQVMMEFLATSDPLTPAPTRAPTTSADLDSARSLAARVVQHEGFTAAQRLELEAVHFAVHTGATTHPTLIGSYIESGSGLTGTPRHVFLIGDYAESTHNYVQSLVHVPADSVREYYRFIDHLDLTDDGIDEIIVESSQKGGNSYLLFLQFRDGHWREIARGPASWCEDMSRR